MYVKLIGFVCPEVQLSSALRRLLPVHYTNTALMAGGVAF